MLCSFCFKEYYSPFIPSPFIPMCSSHSEIWASRGKALFLTNKSGACAWERTTGKVCERWMRVCERERVVNGQCLTQRPSDKPLVTCVFNSRDCSQWMCPPDANDCRQVVLRGHRKAFASIFRGRWDAGRSTLCGFTCLGGTACMAASGQIHESQHPAIAFGNTNASAAGRPGSGVCCIGPLIEFKLEGLLNAEVHRCCTGWFNGSHTQMLCLSALTVCHSVCVCVLNLKVVSGLAKKAWAFIASLSYLRCVGCKSFT